MCGIVAYVGKRQAAPVLLGALGVLEYRGYDSAGIAVAGKTFTLVKRAGRVKELGTGESIEGTAGIGHTRWATHGAPTAANAHPHRFGRAVIVHNGIVENAASLRAECLARGEAFSSETDSEVIAHLLDRYFEGDLVAALRKTASRLFGSYAIAAMCGGREIALARRASPLIVGVREDGVIAASDLAALAEKGTKAYALQDGNFALLSDGGVHFFAENGEEISLEPLDFKGEEGVPAKGGYPHFMRKEMFEIPAAIANSSINYDSFAAKIDLNRVLCQTEYITFLGCGTAYHSGLCAKFAVERLARVRACACLSGEYRYGDPIVKRGELVVAISQSGETADTLAAAQLAKERGALVLAVTNVAYSSLTRIADYVLATGAGREVAVAATKSFSAQLCVLFRLALSLAAAKGKRADLRGLGSLPVLAEAALSAAEQTKGWAQDFLGAKSAFFLGRGADLAPAMEGSLKLKEISYLPSEGYAAGELKHGPLALVEEGTPVVAVLSSRGIAEKTMNAVHETAARGAKVFLVTSLEEACGEKGLAGSVLVPDCGEVFSPVLTTIPLQALAYFVSLARGCDPDMPRNLAKSVTVE